VHGRAPEFLIVGGARCGTTTLYTWLRGHPDVFLPAIKEPSYFLSDAVSYGVRGAVEYYGLFAGAADRVTGEASAGYLADPVAPERIRDELGDVRIIILLRDPVARAYSLWRWMLGEGVEPIRTFESAIAAEEQRAANPASIARFRQARCDYLYVRSGFYAAQVDAYRTRFSQVLVLLSDDLTDRPQQVFAEVCAFIGVGPRAVAPGRTNVSRVPKWVAGQMGARRALQWLGDHEPPGRTVMERLAWSAMELNRRFGAAARPSPETEHRLRAGYVDDLARTATITGLDLSAWIPAASRGAAP
jgi:hypothetical protein